MPSATLQVPSGSVAEQPRISVLNSLTVGIRQPPPSSANSEQWSQESYQVSATVPGGFSQVRPDSGSVQMPTGFVQNPHSSLAHAASRTHSEDSQ